MIEAIKARRSVRTFRCLPLDEKEQALVNGLIKEKQELKGPFGHGMNWFYFNNSGNQKGQSKKIGTYGMVKNPPAFVGAAVKNSFHGMVDFGYLFERFILELTKNGFGTVWLGASFKRRLFDSMVSVGQVVPVIAAFGHPADALSFRERLTRMAIQANTRKPMETMFFNGVNSKPITEGQKSKNPLFKYLKLVRLAPSSSNHQPWRVYIKGDEARFYLHRTPGYAYALPYDIQAIDIGIALCHFEIGLIDDEIPYKIFSDETPDPVTDLVYVATIKIDLKGLVK